MICATRDIILFNKKLNKESRRDMFIPTKIYGVSVYDNRQSSRNGSRHTETENYKIRIPFYAQIQAGRIYIPESRYDALTTDEALGYWTIHNDDLIILTQFLEDVNESVITETALSMDQVEDLAQMIGFQKELINIVDYSDNTLRGSIKVKHWRIGGA